MDSLFHMEQYWLIVVTPDDINWDAILRRGAWNAYAIPKKRDYEKWSRLRAKDSVVLVENPKNPIIHGFLEVEKSGLNDPATEWDYIPTARFAPMISAREELNYQAILNSPKLSPIAPLFKKPGLHQITYREFEECLILGGREFVEAIA